MSPANERVADRHSDAASMRGDVLIACSSLTRIPCPPLEFEPLAPPEGSERPTVPDGRHAPATSALAGGATSQAELGPHELPTPVSGS